MRTARRQDTIREGAPGQSRMQEHELRGRHHWQRSCSGGNASVDEADRDFRIRIRYLVGETPLAADLLSCDGKYMKDTTVHVLICLMVWWLRYKT